MALTEVYELDGVTVGSTELSVTGGTTSLQTQTDDGFFSLLVDDGGNMTKTEEYQIAIYEKVEATGGTKKLIESWTIKGVQSKVFITPALPLMHGWEMTLKKLAGTDRAFDASIRKAA